MLQFDIWLIAVRYFCLKLFTIDYLKCVLLSAQLGSESGHNKQSDIPIIQNIDRND